MAFTHLKAISAKVNAKVRAKLHKIKQKVLKTKAGDGNNTVNNNAALNINEAAVNTTITDVAIIQSNSVTSANGESITIKAPTTAKPQTPVIPCGSKNGASQAVLIQPKMEGLPQRRKPKRQHTRHMLKRRAPVVDNIDDGRPRKKVRHSKQGPLVEHNQANEEGDDVGIHVTSPASQKSDKKAKRAARREARKAKWAMRRTAFKTTVKKILDAAVTPGMIALVTIFSPVIMTLGIVIFVLDSVIMLIFHLLDCLCAPVMFCIWWSFHGR